MSCCRRFLLVLPLLLALPFPAPAQSCGPWGDDSSWGLTFPPPGIDGLVRSAVVFQGEVYVAGDFNDIGDVTTGRVARWDGSRWHPVGLDDPRFIQHLAVHDDELYAVGTPFSDTLVIWKWDGTAWIVEAAGFLGGSSTLDVFLSWDDALYVAGEFTVFLAEEQGNGVVRWDGSELTLAGTTPLRVHDLVVHDDLLVAAFQGTEIDGVPADHVAAYDGTSWTALDGLASYPTALATHDGILYAAGVHQSGSTRSIESWTGSGWSEEETVNGQVLDLFGSVHGLVVSGTFTSPHSGIAKQGFPDWDPLGSGTVGEVHTMVDVLGSLFVAGEFLGMGGVDAPGAALWSGSAWSSPGLTSGAGLDGTVYDLLSWNGDLYAAGLFTVKADPSISMIARWDGSAWHALPGQFDDIYTVHALDVYDGMLVAAGDRFEIDGADPVHGVVSHDGTEWSYLGSLPGGVRDLQVWNGELYAGGRFNDSASPPGPRYLARWTGTTWAQVGSGIPHDPSGFDQVEALGVWNDMLVVGGSTDWTGTVEGPLAAFDGTDWVGLGSLFNQSDSGVEEILSFEGDLVIGGTFCEGSDMCRIARFNGFAWSDVAGGFGDDHAYALIEHEGALIAGGVGDEDALAMPYGIAALGPSCWREMGSGLTSEYPRVFALENHDGRLWVGGEFTAAGGKVSHALARWSEPSLVAVGDDRREPVRLLGPAMPNPTRGGTTLPLGLDAPREVVLEVFSLDGRRLAQPIEGHYPAGFHPLVWDGLDEHGRRPAAGIYFLRVRAGDETVTRKVVLRP